jgi:membrane protein implicated in regulation of membrane protease activity
MAVGDNASNALRPWIAPALGLGLVVTGIALGLGLHNAWAPFVTVAVAAIVLLFGHWRISQRTTTPDDDAHSPSD